ncbi:putative copper resistance protein D [Bradyrhizobium lablabi]|uniref:Putative copper resistance protein D n=1 Tax=Bradyrhizobium lablabi TaxID=722472 RepID=A0A1M7EUT2_9BRAD|nr:copper homeostasis membrane protein CopD [Bradyrhizobium lablabi]SHL95387.1 putative copper resistance protein D [Bradyrhizobium lablabi]
MTWFGAEIDGPMIVVRTIHFAATAVTAGALMFRGVVAEPALRSQRDASAIVDSRIRKVAWISLAIAMVSGLTWVLWLTMSLSGESLGEAVMSGALRDVLNLTQFGWISQIRLALAIVLAICLVFQRSALCRGLALAAAVGLVASIAWTGHAGSTPHKLGYLHLASDALHLIAAAAWIGGLVPLALLLTAGRRYHLLAWAALELELVRRFSLLGIVSVATLIASGLINAWILVGSFAGLVVTLYGWILMLKLIVFAIMVALATVNRFRLTPQLALSRGSEAQCDALRSLTRNTVTEIALGLLVFAIVGLLGTLHPASHFM